MYKDRKEYEKKVDDRLKQLTKDGWSLPVYAKQVWAMPLRPAFSNGDQYTRIETERMPNAQFLMLNS